jgi:hypothetical protein
MECNRGANQRGTQSNHNAWVKDRSLWKVHLWCRPSLFHRDSIFHSAGPTRRRRVGRLVLWNHQARCYSGHTHRRMYRATSSAIIDFLRDKPCSKCRAILRRKTVHYTEHINRRWFRWRKNDRRCVRRGFNNGHIGDRMYRLLQFSITR